MGNTSVLAAVYGPAQPTQTKKEQLDRAVIEVTWKSEKGESLGALQFCMHPLFDRRSRTCHNHCYNRHADCYRH